MMMTSVNKTMPIVPYFIPLLREAGGFIVVGLLILIALSLTSLPNSIQTVSLASYGTTAALWLVGRTRYILLKQGRQVPHEQ